MTVLAARINQSIVSTEIERITPKDAERYLRHNMKNRTIKPTVVRRLAHDLTRNEWRLNGESIKFDVDGNLIDGQHRLLAIVESGKGMTTVVVRNLPIEAQDTVDIGVKRSMGDILHLHDQPDASNLASALTYLYNIRTRQLRYRGAGYQAATPADLLLLLENDPRIVDSMTPARALRKRLRLPMGQMTAMHYWFSELDREDADLFFDSLARGENLAQGNPIFALRRWVEQTAWTDKRVRAPLIHAYVVKAWNSFRRNEEIHSLRYRMAIDTWPEPV